MSEPNYDDLCFDPEKAKEIETELKKEIKDIIEYIFLRNW